MEKLKPFVALLCLLTTVSVSGQIVVGGEENTKPDSKEKNESLVQKNNKQYRETTGESAMYVFLSRAYNNRSLAPNGALFGDSLGKRGDEMGLKTLCFGLGFRNKIKNDFYFGGGISIYNNGESYKFEESDTLFQYESKYGYIGMPLFLEYNTGKTLQFIGTVGIAPAMFTRYKQEQNWRTTLNVEGDSLVKFKNGNQKFNSFVISGFVSAGVALELSPLTTFYIKPEYRFQLNSSYSKINPYIHKARAFSVNFGIIYEL